jgi:hypothetical protein
LITLYGLSAAIGDIKRFSTSRKLTAYFGLNPSVEQTGNWEGGAALKRHGHGALRALLVQSAKQLLRINNPLQKWGHMSATLRSGRPGHQGHTVPAPPPLNGAWNAFYACSTPYPL